MNFPKRISEAIVITDDELMEAYRYDESHVLGKMPIAVVKPHGSSALRELVRLAKTDGFCLVPRGAGTGKAGGCTPTHRSVVVDMSDYPGEIIVSKADLCLQASASTTLKDIKATALGMGLYYPPDPNSWEICTFGGSIATNAGGPASCKYGMTRNWVLSVQALMDDGELHTFGIPSVKCNTGPSIEHLLVGSEGIFGIIASATVRVITRPCQLLTLLLPVKRWHDLLDLPGKLVSAGYLPSAFEFWDPAVMRDLRTFGPEAARRMPGEALALLEFDNHNCQSDSFLEGLLDVLGPLSECLQIATDVHQREALWAVRRITSTHIKDRYPRKISEDIVVPRSSISAFFDAIDAMRLPIITYGHLSDGNLHVNLLEAGETDHAVLENQLLSLFKLCIRLGGAISGEHGIGIAKKMAFAQLADPYHIHIVRAIKQSLDPLKIFNPGKVI